MGGLYPILFFLVFDDCMYVSSNQLKLVEMINMYVIPQPNSREYVLVLKSIKISRDDQYVCNITTKFSPM